MLALCASLLAAGAADWPQWRGPDCNGISKETGWQGRWGASGPKVAWSNSLGTGFSSISVSKGRVYCMGNRADSDFVFCFNAEDGEELWKYSYPAPIDAKMFEGGPCCTPTVDGGQVFTLSRRGLVLCLTADAGKLVWQADVEKMDFPMPTWGYAGSACIEKDAVLFNVGAAGIAFDKNTGKVLWQSDKKAPGYSTPVPCIVDGRKIVAMVGAQTVVGIDPTSGSVVWSYPWQTSYDINATDALVSGNRVFVSAAYAHGATVFEVKDGQTTKIWESKEMRNHINSSILIDGYVYGFDGDAEASDGQLRCLDFRTGETKWSTKLPAGSLIAADKRLIVLTSKGELITAEVSTQEFKAISRSAVLTGKCWTPPTLANGKIYCRNASGELVCLDVSH